MPNFRWKRSSTMMVPPSISAGDEKSVVGVDANSSSAALMAPPQPLPPLNLKVERLDYYYSRWTKSWKYKSMGEHITPEAVPAGTTSSGKDHWACYCFVVVRKLPQKGEEPTFTIYIKSQYLRTACKDVMQTIPGISWTKELLDLEPHLVLAFLPQFEKYHRDLMKKQRTPEEKNVMATVGVLTEYLRKDYRATLATLDNLTTHGEITFDLLFAIMVPHSILITTCPTTGAPRALQLMSATKIQTMSGGAYDLLCESVDLGDEVNVDSNRSVMNSCEVELRKAGGGRSFGKVQNRVIIPAFDGIVKINSLATYPIKFHADEAGVREALITRGRKWLSLRGVHHMQYKGTGALTLSTGSNGCKRVIKYNVNSRVMIDRENFKRLNPNYEFPTIKQESQENENYDPSDWQPRVPNSDPNHGIPALAVQTQLAPTAPKMEITEDELLLASPIVYGFSLTDKIWLEFNVESITPIIWNDEAFHNLVLPEGRKALLQSLVEAHNADIGFDDFVKGKGEGLIINLFGPPGVGKTLSAEATSEHVRRPLYVVGGGDLGTTAAELDSSLQRVFDIATGWKAIVLIDEADVFLEQRSLHDLERNAMVAVFLRHVEYYRGILFLTTNRVKSFDEAFLSRIHVALHFTELSRSAKMQVWTAFLQKVGVKVGENGITKSELERLVDREINGRQIKNATRTANSLAISRGQPLAYSHLLQTLEAMEDFTAEFHRMRA